jgi:hypothetical protein
MKKKFRNRLAQRGRTKKIHHYGDDLIYDPTGQPQFKDDWTVITELCTEYGIVIDERMYERLAFALARDFVPAFQTENKTGPKIKWTDDRTGFLIVELELTIWEHDDCSIREAARKLANTTPWSNFVQTRDHWDGLGNPAETLYRRYLRYYLTPLANQYRNEYIELAAADQRETWRKKVSEAVSDWE